MNKRSRKPSDADVASYWLEHDSTELVDWSQPGVRLEFDPDVERPTRSVTVRLPRRLVQELRVLAKDRDVPYQSLLKMLLAEKVAELRRKRAS
jgi:predicted DNA binding CopG/RHH family protein